MPEAEDRVRKALDGRYVIEREIGSGGMATVYLAEDVAHDRKVAVKVLHPEIASSVGPERFLREIKIAAKLDHPYIVPLFASGEADGLLYYVMPYVEGETLQDRLEREGQLPVDVAIRIVSDVAEGLEYAHEQGVVHRDVRPAKILLSAGHARVTDFGVARALDAASGHDMTLTGLAMGTPKYMSPEQASGEGEADRRSDVYSLGRVLWESLAGQAPFDGPSAQAIRKTVNPALAATLEKALAASPRERHPTARAFADNLSQGGVGAPAGRPRLRRRFQDLGSTAKAAVILGVAAVLTVGGMGLISGLQERNGRDNAGVADAVVMNPNRLAVAPFSFLDTTHAAWSEGVVDYLSRTLDHIGELTTVPPSTVVGQWSGNYDVAGASQLGEALGAGLVVFGTLSERGSDSVLVDATVVDVVSGNEVGDVSIVGPIGRMDHVVDSLAVAMLRQIQTVRTIGSVKYTSIGSRSMPALKAFLQGEQAFRRTAWDSSIVLFERAVELDSMFALAHARLGLSLTLRMIGGPDSRAHWRKAGELNQGLSRHDSLIVVLGAGLFGAYDLPNVPGVGRDTYLNDLATRVAAEYPDDPEAWSFLAAVRKFTAHTQPDVTPKLILEAWANAIAADSTYGPAYYFGFESALSLDRIDLARDWARKFLAMNPPDWSRAVPLLLDRMLDPAVRDAEVNRLIDSVPQHDLWKTFLAMNLMTDEEELAIELARRAAGLPGEPDAWVTKEGTKYRNLAVALAYRGHVQESAEIAGTNDPGWGWYPNLTPELAWIGAWPEAVVDSMYAAWLRDEGTVYHALFWWAVHGDTASIRIASGREPKSSKGNGTGGLPAAYALARADTSEFLAQMEEWRPGSWEEQNAVILYARVLVALGRDQQAYEVLLQKFTEGQPAPSRVVWTLERARLAEKLGDTDQAIRDYRYVARAWVHADESLQPVVREAQEAIFRLAG